MIRGALLQTGAEGVDVSHHQGAVGWKKVKSAGKEFAFIKATEGSTVQDKNFSANWTGALDAGIVRGAYHFLSPLSAVENQVKNFVNVVGGLAPGDLAPALDMEDANKWKNVSDPVDRALAWLEQVEDHYGRRPYFYSDASFIGTILRNDKRLKKYPLWLARWGNTPNPIPAPWTQCSIWQYSEKGGVSGISGNVDLDKTM